MTANLTIGAPRFGKGARLLLAAGALALLSLAAHWTGAAPAGATAATCDGRTASIVYTSAGFVLGTAGDDVIAADDPLLIGGAVEIQGLDGDDIICGTDYGDVIAGNGGEDRIFGLTGGDCLFGEDGFGAPGYPASECDTNALVTRGDDDYIEGGPGNDRIWGQLGIDTLKGGTDNDDIFGGDRGDHLYGGPGRDFLDGNSGDDNLHGDHDSDDLFGGSGSDDLFGGDDNDYLDGQSGNDSCHGGSGADTLTSC
jgi:Ca2+-binding RTX toxin-like protein